jgi:hypothetical protein
LYLHLWEVTPGTALRLNCAAPIVRAQVLESGQPVVAELGRDGICLHLPGELAGLELPVIALDLATDLLKPKS